jgi:predicted metalloendopeptidase
VCALVVANAMEPVLAAEYLPQFADARSEAVARKMFAVLRGNLEGRVMRESWLDGAGRNAARARLAGLRLVLIGDVAPPELPGLRIGGGSFLSAFGEMNAWAAEKELRTIGAPPEARPLVPNLLEAAYFGGPHAIWLSPKIVRPPYVRADRFNAATFGTLGATIGHELGHALWPRGLPEEESGGDGSGTWSAATLAVFRRRVACVEQEFNVLDTTQHTQLYGRQTLEENVSDLIGVELALAAMEGDRSRPTHDRSPQAWRKEFFMAFAQAFCLIGSDDRSEARLLVDPHAPVGARINGTVANVPEFAEAFGCAPGARLAPAHRCQVW